MLWQAAYLPTSNAGDTKWTIACSTEPFSAEQAKSVTDRVKLGPSSNPQDFLEIDSDWVKVLVRKSDPTLQALGAVTGVWRHIAQQATAATDLSDISLPEGPTGAEIQNLFRASYPRLAAWDSTGTKMAVYPSFRVEAVGGSNGIFWELPVKHPPDSAATEGAEPSKAPISNIDERRTLAESPTFVMVPVMKAPKQERGAAAAKAIDLFSKLLSDRQDEATTAMRQMYDALLERQKLQGMSALVGKDLKPEQIPKGIAQQLDHLDHGTFQSLQRAGAVRIVPYITFLMRGKNKDGKSAAWSVSILAPPAKTILPIRLGIRRLQCLESSERSDLVVSTLPSGSESEAPDASTGSCATTPSQATSRIARARRGYSPGA